MTAADLLSLHRDEILAIAERHGARNIRVFGSVARGEADEASDIDFLVDMDTGRSLFDLFVSSVQNELEDERLIVQNLLNTDPFLLQHCAPVLYELEPASPERALRRLHCRRRRVPALPPHHWPAVRNAGRRDLDHTR